jgi:hypothetical protein
MNDIRRQARVECDIILNKTERGVMNVARATNISLSGMRIQRLLDPYQSADERVQFELELPGIEEPLIVSGKKVYEGGDHFGVRFTEISHRHFMKLRSWLADHTLPQQLPMFQ